MANSADPDQLPTDLDLHCLQKQGISGFSRIRVNSMNSFCIIYCHGEKVNYQCFFSLSLKVINHLIIKC